MSGEPHSLVAPFVFDESARDSEVVASLVVPVEPSKGNPVDVYEASLESANSRRALRDSLRRVLVLLGKTPERWRDAPWHRLSPEQVTEIRKLLIDNFELGTARLALSMLRGVLRQAWRLGYMDRERLARLTEGYKIKGKRALRGRMLELGEIQRCRVAAESWGAFEGARNAGVFALCLGAGMRRDEVASVRVEDVADDAKTIQVLGKGNKLREIPLVDWVGATIETWLAQRARFEFVCAELFVDVQSDRAIDRPMSRWQVWRTLGRIGKRAEVKLTPHDLRRTFISELLETVDISTVAQLAGHEQTTTTGMYDRRPERTRMAAVQVLKKWGS